MKCRTYYVVVGTGPNRMEAKLNLEASMEMAYMSGDCEPVGGVSLTRGGPEDLLTSIWTYSQAVIVTTQAEDCA